MGDDDNAARRRLGAATRTPSFAGRSKFIRWRRRRAAKGSGRERGPAGRRPHAQQQQRGRQPARPTLTSTSRCWVATLRGRSSSTLCSRSASVAAKYSPPVTVATSRSVASSATRKFRPPPPAPPPGPEAPDAPAAQLGGRADHRRRVAGAEPDRIHPHPALGGDLGRLHRLDAAGVGAVGEQHDDLRRERPRRSATACRPAAWSAGAGPPGRRRAGVGGRHLRVDLGDRVDGLEDGGADRGAPAGGQRVDGAQQRLPVGRRGHRDLREAGEQHQPDAGARRPGPARTRAPPPGPR